MATKHIKGENVVLLVSGSVIASSSSCDFTLNAQTSDGASKDVDGMWDNPEFQYNEWSCSNESFLTNASNLLSLLTMITGDSNDNVVEVQFQVGADARKGNAVITSLNVTSAIGDDVKVSLSFEGAGTLSTTTASTITKPGATPHIKGKALMVGVKDGNNAIKTIACATNHTLAISCQTGDTRDKDLNDLAPHKEITGKSISITSENFVPADSTGGEKYSSLMGYAESGKTLKLYFGYYPDSIGEECTDGTWGEADQNLLTVDAIITSISVSGSNKDTATYSIQFSGKGKPTVVQPTAGGTGFE